MRKKPFLARENEKYVPGKSPEDLAKELGVKVENIAALGSNENPWGPSPAVTKIFRDVIRDKYQLSRFPDKSSKRELIKAISNKFKVPKEKIVLGAGSDGVFDTLAKVLTGPNDEVIIPTPTFLMYRLVNEPFGAKIVFLKRKDDFGISASQILISVNLNTRIIYLCSPNNPDSKLMDKEAIKKILERVSCYVLVDEAYIEYANPGSSVIDLIKDYPNLIITRTFSKAYGLANLRIGYGIMPEDLARDYNRTNPPFFTSSLAVKAAKLAIEDESYLKRVVELNRQERDYLCQYIRFRVVSDPQGNFVLVDISPLKAKYVVAELEKKGIIVRDCSYFGEGMDSFIRVTVGKTEQNQKVVKALNILD